MVLVDYVLLLLCVSDVCSGWLIEEFEWVV